MREFHEEASVHVPLTRWVHISTERFKGQEREGEQADVNVYHFASVLTLEEWRSLRQCTEEKLVLCRYPLEVEDRYIYNMMYLVPMAYILLRQPDSNRPVPIPWADI